MPGKKEGNVSQVYAYRVFNKIIKNFNYLIDLHTASFGRVNSYYIRADMDTESTRKMALLQNAQIIVHNPPSDGTLRGAAEDFGIAAITLEVGDPNRFQKGMIRSSLTGIHNVLHELNMIAGDVEPPEKPAVICKSSYWIYTKRGGILTVHPHVTDMVKKDEVVATLRNIFGDVIKEYLSPEDGIVIGKSSSPINQSGGRILHLGILQ
jgi:predicted deacylase